jgi:hypothetical protein
MNFDSWIAHGNPLAYYTLHLSVPINTSKGILGSQDKQF